MGESTKPVPCLLNLSKTGNCFHTKLFSTAIAAPVTTNERDPFKSSFGIDHTFKDVSEYVHGFNFNSF